MSCLLIYAEISFVSVSNIYTSQILLIRRIKKCNVLIEYTYILLLEHLTVIAEQLVSIFIVLAVFGDLVDEEQ